LATRNGSAEWRGDLQSGSGTLEVGDGVFSGDYSFASRFEEGEGTNPEELIAAAHAACFSMALSHALAQAGTPPEQLQTSATVTFVPGTGITKIALAVRGTVPGVDEGGFRSAAENAKVNCPVSQALAAVPEITLDAQLA